VATVDCGSPPDAGAPLQGALSKSEAILGGQVSALDRIRLAQTETSEPAAPPALAARPAETGASLVPSAGGFRPGGNFCPASANWPTAPGRTRSDYSSEDFLASKRLSIGQTAFDRDWSRVSREQVSASRYRRLVGKTGEDTAEKLDAINRWVNQAITYTEDRELFGRADFWAGAHKTLKLGRGDCEDIALTKMQLLAAAGIPREDMILTIARDLVRNADHAVLMVGHAGGFVMLDNTTDQVLDASTSHDYQPVLSFGANRTWLHGY